MDTYIYNAYVENIYDGDTITCTIDCGFGVFLKKQKIRLYELNAPEIRGETREDGIISRDALRNKILQKNIILKTIKDKKGKYGRYLGIIYYKNENINDWLIENKYAVKKIY